MSEQDILYKPYDSAFRTLVALCPQLLIPVVNELFGTTFTYDDKVVLMDPKQMVPAADGEIATREVDSLFTINDDRRVTYHVECQSRPDDTMVVRFWEYDSHAAMMTAEITPDGAMDIEFPRSAVLYLRHNENTPDTLTIRLKRTTGGSIVLHEIPVIKVQSYDLDELIDKGLLFLFPYYMFRYEDVLADHDADEDRSAALRDDLARMLEHLDGEREGGRIDRMTQHSIQGAMMSVLSGLARGYENAMKGVGRMLEGQILDLEVFRIHDKAWDEGEAAGIAKGRAEGRAAGRAEGIAVGEAKGRAAGRAAGRSEGIAVGEAKGKLEAYIGLVRDDLMTPSVAAARLHISESEFLAKCDAVPDDVF